MAAGGQDTPPGGLADAVRVALADMPPAARDTVDSRLAAAAARFAVDADTRPLGALLGDLVLTARVHRNPYFAKALAEADADLDREIAQALGPAEVVAAVRSPR